MNKGNLTFKGTIDLNQFWPQNIKSGNTADSDADTVKVKIDKSSVKFISPSGKSKSTSVFSDAGFFHTIKNKAGVKSLKFKPVIDPKGNIDMRLQGIDAPELHYMTRIFGNPLYRQPWGETSTIELYNFLKSHTASNLLLCEVSTQVNKPNDVFDKFGRCVGDIFIKDKKGTSININHWLVEQGFAYPAFYNSMTNQEIKDILSRAASAKTKKLNIWKSLSLKMEKLDRSLTHDKKDPSYSAKDDKKPPVLFPKIFRRLWTFEIQNKQVFTTDGYQKFLLAQKDDRCCKTSDFLKSGFPKKAPLLGSFVSPNGKINFLPADIVFKEAGSSLKNSKDQLITSF